MTTVHLEKSIHARPSLVFRAFTNATLLTHWLCDFASALPRPGGRLYLWWVGDYYSSGEYISLEENKSVVFKWCGRSEPGPSQVTVTINEKDSGSLVNLAHEVPGEKKWQKVSEDFHKEWAAALDNLASILETGKDLRIWNRPMIGISGFSDFNAEIAKQMGIPVSEGSRVDATIEGMGAQKAGLQNNDVLVKVDGKPITGDFNSFALALQGKKAGDVVEVVFYRGPEKKTVQMELSRRPEPDIPWEPALLGKATRARYDVSLAALEEAFKGVSEKEAENRPAPGEWNAKETLAHLIHNERILSFNLVDSLGGFDRWADDWGGNVTTQVEATVAAYPTVADLMAELRRNIDEIIYMVSHLPPIYVERKSSYLNTANIMLNIQSHALSHIEQIRAAIESARKK